MAGGDVISSGPRNDYGGGITPLVIFTCMVASMGGLIFGYEIGVSGGVTSMEFFLRKFFHSIYVKQKEGTQDDMFCKFNSQLLTWFTSSIYLAALVATFAASMAMKIFSRKISLFVGGIVSLVGAVVNGAADDVATLIVGRLLLGVGVGFANESVPVYLSEMAPAKLRGALNIGFQMAITIGILAANLINYRTAQIHGGWGWRLSLGLAGVPAIMITIGSLILPDTPNSIMERGYPTKARALLKRVRGTDNVDAEFDDLVDACNAAKKVKHPWRNIFQPKYRPQLVICCLVPFFQQLTGINVIMFYAPVLFVTLGLKGHASLMSTVITGSVNVGATVVSLLCVDRFGRRKLFLVGGLQMIICQVVIGVMLAVNFGSEGSGHLTSTESSVLVFLICGYVSAFAWSWGPLGWLVPSEICPLEIRSAGQAINVSVNMFFTFVIRQFFQTMFCHMKFGLFVFFAGWVVVMTMFIFFFLPETKNVPIEEMNMVWKGHWYWRRYFSDAADIDNNGTELQNFGS